MDSSSAPGVSGLKVLVVGINFAPEHTGISPYTTQACEFLAGQGAEVLVLSGVPHYPHWTVPAEYRRRLTTAEQHGQVAVRRLRHFVPREQTAFKRALYEATFGAHVAVQRLPWRPDVVLTVVPSLLGAAAGALIAQRTGARLVTWVQDLMGPAAAQSGIAGGGKVARVTQAIERRLLRRSDEVVVLNDAFRRYVLGLGVAPESVIIRPNWTHIAAPTGQREATRRRLGWTDDEVVVLHSGNMGLKQALENVVEAARLSDGSRKVRFVLMGDGSQRRDLEDRAQGVAALQFLPPASDAEFSDLLDAADVLLINERASALDMSLPSKLTSYFKVGRPVVAAVNPDGGTASEVRRSGAGIITLPESPSALIDAVIDITDDSAQLARMRAAANSYAAQNLSADAALLALARSVTTSRRS